MPIKNELNQIAKSIGNSIRVDILTLLMSGSSLTAKEISLTVGVDPSSMTHHLNILTKAKLIQFTQQGRFKYYSLVNNEVAHLLESMMVLSTSIKPKRVLPNSELCSARLCYDHLAGKLGVEIYNFLKKEGFITCDNKIIKVNKSIHKFLDDLEIRGFQCKFNNRKTAFGCLDWSERTMHVAGALGVAISKSLINMKWVETRKGSRVVTITSLGQDCFLKNFGIDLKANKLE